MGYNDLLLLVKDLTVSERLLLVEAIIKELRATKIDSTEPDKQGEENPHWTLKYAGIWANDTSDVFEQSLAETRKIDLDGW